MRRPSGPLARYGITIVIVSAGLALTRAARTFAPDVRFPPSFVAIAVSALVAGTDAGLLAFLLSAVGVATLVMPAGSFAQWGSQTAAFSVFAVAGAVIALAIGPRRRAELRLLESEGRHRALAEELEAVTSQMPAAVTRCSRDLRIVWASAGYAAWLRQPIDAIVGRPIVDLLGGDAFATLRPVFDTVLAGERVDWEGELNVRGLGKRWIDAVWVPTRDARGVPDGWVALVTDVTHRKELEAGLREADRHRAAMAERLAVALDSARMFAWTWDVRRHEVVFSENASALFGAAVAEQPADADQGWSIVHPEDRPLMAATIERALRDQREYAVETRHILADGTVAWMETRGRVDRDPSGDAVRVHGVTIDVTERKRTQAHLRRSEEQLRLALESAQMGIFDIDPATGAVVCDDGVARIFGVPAEDIRDLAGGLARVDPDDRARMEEGIRAAFAPDADGRYEGECRILRPDGTVRWAVARGQVFFEGDGAGRRAVRMIGIGIDTTAQKATEAALIEADRRKDEFLAMLAHELRNPLGPIRNAVGILKLRAPDDEKVTQARTIIDRQVTHMVRLIDDLLDVSRITLGKIALQKERVALRDVVEQAIDTVRAAIEAQRQTLHVSLPTGRMWVHADPARLVQVVGNLLSNAMKYTDPGGTIGVTVERTHDHAVVTVRDDGIGIEPGLLPHVFELFVQEPSTLARQRGGLGIGLTLVKTLVELHGGRVVARSDGRGRGSEFVVRLPAEAPRDERPPRVLAPPVGSGSRLDILIVEDNPDAADSLAMLLELAGHTVRIAPTGTAAVELAETLVPDVAFVDIGLPGLDGYAVAERLRARVDWRGTLLVAVSGYGRDEDRRRALASGFDRHMTKPVGPEAVTALLQDVAAGLAHAARTLH